MRVYIVPSATTTREVRDENGNLIRTEQIGGPAIPPGTPYVGMDLKGQYAGSWGIVVEVNLAERMAPGTFTEVVLDSRARAFIEARGITYDRLLEWKSRN